MKKSLFALLLTSVLCVSANTYANSASDELPQVLQDILLDSKPLDEGAKDFSNVNESNTQTYESKTPFTDMAGEVQSYSKTINFAQNGSDKGIVISAGQSQMGFNFTLPIDKVVVSSKLELYVKLTKKMANRGSHLEVSVNGQALGSLPLVNTDITNYELELPSEYLSQDNTINFEISDDKEFTCMIDYTDDYQVIIDKNSFLSVEGYALDIGADLSFFPLPFLDANDTAKEEISFVFPESLKSETLKAAAMLASYFGRIAQYKKIDFSVYKDKMPKKHAIIFGAPGDQIAGEVLPEKEGIYIRDNPYYKNFKQLFIVAANEEGLLNAVGTLSSLNVAQGTTYVPVKAQKYQYSEPYDAPYWISTTDKVYLKDLLKKGQSLTANGFWHSPLSLNFKSAPDLYQLYEGEGDLYISYEFPLEKELDEAKSSLQVSMSGKYLDELPVNKKGLLENLWRISGGDVREANRHVQIFPQDIYGDNSLDLYFNLYLKKDAPCSVLHDTNLKSVIDPSSYIDLSKTVHFARLPNLTFFASATFPFSRNADFSKSAILLPENPSLSELKTLFNILARSGKATGTLVTHSSVFMGEKAFTENLEELTGKDLLIVSTVNHEDFINRLIKDSAFVLKNHELNVYDYGFFSLRGGLLAGLERLFAGDFRKENVDANRYLRTLLSYRGLLSFISPFDKDRVAVMVTATEDDQLDKIGDDLDNSEISKNIRGDMSIISGDDQIVTYSVGDFIYSGDVSSGFRVMFFASEHVIWLGVTSFIMLIILSAIISSVLQRRAKKRLSEGDDQRNDF